MSIGVVYFFTVRRRRVSWELRVRACATRHEYNKRGMLIIMTHSLPRAHADQHSSRPMHNPASLGPGVATQPWTPISPHETPSSLATAPQTPLVISIKPRMRAEDTSGISEDLRGTGGTPVRPGERDQESRSRGPREQDRTDAPPDGSHTRGRRSAAGRLAVGSWTRLSTCSAGQRARPMPMQQPADVASGAWRKERAGERKERVTRASSPSTDRNRGRISRRSDCSPHLESQTQLVIATQLPQESRRTHSRDADLAGG
jgi:hypothetical protein